MSGFFLSFFQIAATETGFRRIDEIRAGDRVWSYNVETGERALKAVKEVLVRENDELLHIETSRGVVDATTSHPFINYFIII